MNSDQQKQPASSAQVKSLNAERPQEAEPRVYEFSLNWYKTNGKNLIGNEVLSTLSLRKLMKILGNPLWNQLYHCWSVELKHMPDLQPYVEHQFDPDKFVYFIEAYSIS